MVRSIDARGALAAALGFVAVLGAAGSAGAQDEPAAPDPARGELEELRRERDSHPLEGPAVLTLASAVCVPGCLVGGLGVFLGADWPGAVTSAVGITLFALSGAAFVTLVIGAIWWGSNDRARRHASRRIRELEVAPVAWAAPGGASFGLAGAF
jgi:hypothetical protein